MMMREPLNDLLIQAGGLTGSASNRVEVARMIQSEEINDQNKAQLFNIEIKEFDNCPICGDYKIFFVNYSCHENHFICFDCA